MNKNFLLGILFCVACCLFFQLGRSTKINEEIGQIKIERDTIYKTDTITIDKPIEKIRYKDKLVYVPVLEKDTLLFHDTLFVALQSEKVVYEDTTYRAVVSGIKPKLDTISVFPKTVYITEKETRTVKKRWDFSVTVGPAVIYNGKVRCGTGVMAGFGYHF